MPRCVATSLRECRCELTGIQALVDFAISSCALSPPPGQSATAPRDALNGRP